MINKIINIFGEKPYKNIPSDGTRVKKRLLFNGIFEPPLHIRSSDGGTRRIGNVGIETELYIECKEYPIKLARYRAAGSENSIAESAIADVDIHGEKFRFEILAPGAGEYVPAGAAVTFQSIPLSEKDGKKKNKK